MLGLVLPNPFGVIGTNTWEVNSFSRCNSKLRIISSKDVPVSAPEGLNRQPHTEQPKPRKCCCSIHTSSRLMAASVAAPQRVPACCQGTKRSGSPLTGLFAAAYCLIAAENRHPVWAWRKMHKKMHKRMGEVYMRQFWMVCRTSYIHGKVLFVRTPDFGPPLK